MIKLSINGSAVLEDELYSKDEIAERLLIAKQAGFQYIEANPYYKPEYIRYKWVQALRRALKETDMEVCQTRVATYGGIQIQQTIPYWQHTKFQDIETELAFRANAEWDCKYAVVSPVTPPFGWYEGDLPAYRRINVVYLQELLRVSHKYKVRVCLETPAPKVDGRHYCDKPQEMVDVFNMTEDRWLKYCINVDNLKKSGYSVPDTIRIFGKNLHVVNLPDMFSIGSETNMGESYLSGWESIARALKDIEFDGNLNFNLNPLLTKNYTKEQKSDFLKYAFQLGSYMKRLVEE